MKNLPAMVERFHEEVLGMPTPSQPVQLHPQRKAWAITAMLEELVEFRDSTSLEEQADALADLVYFAIGRSVEMGFDFNRVFAEVHKKNMLKERGSMSKRPGSQGYDAIKPLGWAPPHHVLQPINNRKPRLIIIGHGGHGKDEVASTLCELLGLRNRNASYLCAEKIMYPVMTRYSTVEECYADRVNNRQIWRSTLAAYRKNDPARIARMVFEESDIYCGIRGVKELEAAREIADYVVWVDASERLPTEPTCDLRASMADIIINNNGSKQALYDNVCRVAKLLEN